MCVIGHDQGDAECPGVKNRGKEHESRRGDVNQIGAKLFQDAGALHFGQIYRETDLVVEGEGKALGVSNGVIEEGFGQFFGRSLGVDGKNINLIAGFGKKLEHFFESIGVARHVRKGRRFHHETNATGRCTAERRCVRGSLGG